MSGWIHVSNSTERLFFRPVPRARGRGVKAALMSPDQGCAHRACSRSVWGRAGAFSIWDARRDALPIAELLASIATPQTARKDTCPSGWDAANAVAFAPSLGAEAPGAQPTGCASGRFAHQSPCMGISPCGRSWRSTHPDCVPTRPHTDRDQALTSLRLHPASSGNRLAGAPTVVRQRFVRSGRPGGLQSEVKEEGWRSQPGGHERHRPPGLPEPAGSMFGSLPA